MPPIFDEQNPAPARTGHEYGKERDLTQQICFSYRNLVNRIEAIGGEIADEIILATEHGDTDKAKILSHFALMLRDAHNKNVKLKTKMEAQGLGH